MTRRPSGYPVAVPFMVGLFLAGLASDASPASAAGSPGCGLPAAAFCETFESGPAPVAWRGRGGELDRRRFSASRYTQPLATTGDVPFWVRDAELGLMAGEPAECRAGLPTFLPVSDDTLICEPNAHIQTRHLVTATASQNYGVNSYRIRQPFDFAGRTGRLVFDLDLHSELLLGYSSVVISDDPAPTANWDLNGRGPNPRNGLLIVFVGFQRPQSQASVSVHEIQDYATIAVHEDLFNPPVDAARGRLNHIQISLSTDMIQIEASAPSTDGIQFPPPSASAAVTLSAPLPFDRGYVALLSHNHATWKYTQENYGTPHPLRSWNAYWDNIGFDGPVIAGTREYEVPDSNIAYEREESYLDANGQTVTLVQPGRTVGYLIPNDPTELSDPLTFTGVSLEGATRARLVLTGYYQNWNQGGLIGPDARLIYQINGFAPHERPFTDGERAMIANEAGQGGGVNHAIDLPLAELQEGNNVFRFSTRALASGYSNAVLNLDLLLDVDLGQLLVDSFE